MEREIVLKRDIKIKDKVWRGGKYRVPKEMAGELADWLLDRRPDIAELVASEPSKPEELGSVGPPPQKLAFDKFQEMVGSGDYIEIFAPAGCGKSRLLAHVALEAKRSNKKILYLDCEHSLPKRIEKELGDGYQRLDFMSLDRIIERIASLPKGMDAVFYDSVGFPVMIKFVTLNLRERGDAIAKTILLRGYLKHYAEANNALAIATNQPVSELYGMSHDLDEIEHRPPVGGKSIHIAKAVLRLSIARQDEKESVFELRAFECQDMPFNKLIAVFTINEQGEKLEWKI